MTDLPDTETLARAGLRCEISGAVATVTLDRPASKNSQKPSTWRALAAISAALPLSVRVVVLIGAGDDFSSGMDRAMLTPEGPEGETSLLGLLEMDDDDLADEIGLYQEGFTWLRRPDLVTIAAVRGWAIGAGFQLALACDLRVVAEDARFCMKEPALGLVPDLTGTKSLVEIVGYSRALEICVTARNVGATEAGDLGIATVVVPGDQLEATVADLAGAISAHLPGAVTETKALLQAASERDLDSQRLAERQAQVRRMRELAALMQ